MHQEDAMGVIIEWIRMGSRGSFGYEVYLPVVINDYLDSIGTPDRVKHKTKQEVSSAFMDAAWDLCQRGILRPGIREWNTQATEDGNAGNGFSITPFGRLWIEEADSNDFIPTQPERFASMLEPFRSRFGDGFHIRAQEAIRCYNAHAYYACCAMCGAAAESVLLATAISIQNDEDAILKMYVTASGRRKVENVITGKAKDYIKREFDKYMDLLKYWRDSASHGRASNISNNEAFTSLLLSLRFCGFINDNWAEITK